MGDDKQAVVDGYGLFERRAAVKRVTDWDAILDRIAHAASTMPTVKPSPTLPSP